MYSISHLLIFLFGFSTCFSKRSFTILLDTTVSMQDEIDEIKSNIGPLVNELKTTDVDKYVLVPFSDPDVGPPLYSATPEGLINALNAVNVSGGHDCPENSLSGMQKALEISDQDSYIFVFTDAYAKDSSQLAALQNLCRSTRSQIIIFLSGRCYPESARSNINVYFDVAKSCNGGVIKLAPTDLRQAFTFMKQIILTDWNSIVNIEAFNRNKDFTIAVDSSTTELMIAVYGENIALHIMDEQRASPRIYKITDSRHSKIFRITDLKIGQYRVDVRSDGTTAVTIYYKRNNFPFKYGFSTRFPKSLKETTLRPIPGWTNYFSILVPENSSIKLNHLELIKMNNDEKTNLTLHESNFMKGLYYTSAFFGPDTMFQITVSGKDETNGQDIVRSLSRLYTQNRAKTSVWTSPVVEMLEPESIVDFGTNVTVACKVTGFPKPNISWQDDTRKVVPSEDVLLEIPNVYISYGTIDYTDKNLTIYCIARNPSGESYQSSQIYVKGELKFNVIHYPIDTNIPYGSESRLYCEADTYPEAKISWYHNGTLIDDFTDNIKTMPEENLILIKNMTLQDVGEYKCEITNEIETKVYTADVTISGLEEPSVEIEKTELNLRPGACIEIECVTKGQPEPEVGWKFKKHNEDYFSSLPYGVYAEDKKIKVASVEMNHAGIYRCEAFNILGSAYGDVDIKIQYAPVMSNVEDSLTVNEGDTVELKCDVDAIPAAQVRWEMYQDDVIIAFDHRHTTDDHHVHRFQALWKDSGKYLCVAENSIGRTEKTVTINVLVPPYIETPPSKTITARVGSSVTLLCNVLFGNPVPTTLWEFMALNSTSTVLLRSISTTTLRLTDVQKRNEGSYMCIADNKVGTDSIKIHLNVQ